jgi:PAS domain S-box-containing protein
MLRIRSIRGHLFALQIVVAAALVALLSRDLFENLHEDLEESRAASLRQARTVAASAGRILEEAVDLLDAIGDLPLVRAPHARDCDPLFAGFSRLFPRYAGLVLTDGSGRVHCSAAPAPEDAEPAWFHDALESDGIAVGRLRSGGGPGGWVVPVARVLRDREGRVASVIALEVDAARFQEVLDRIALPAGGLTMILDDRGTVVARSLDPSLWVGRDARETEVARSARATVEGNATVLGVDGIERLYGIATLPVAGWKAVSAVPVSVAYGPAWRAFGRGAAVAVVFLLGASAMVFALLRRCAQPARALATAVHAMAEGRLDTRVPESGPDELRRIAVGFNEMAGARERAERELEDLLLRERRSRENAEAERARNAVVLERITDSFVALDADWRYTYVNRKAAETFSRRPEDLIGKHIWTEFPEGIGQKFDLAYRRAMAEQVPLAIEEYYPPYDRWFENRIYPSQDGLSIYFQDITDRKRAELERERLLVEEHRARTEAEETRRSIERILARIADGFVVFDREGRYTFVNTSAAAAFDRRPEELIGKTLLEAFPQAAGSNFEAALRRALAEQRPQTSEDHILPADRWLSGILYPDADGVSVFFRDVTEERRASNAAREAGLRLELAVQASKIGLWDWNLVTNEVFFSREWKNQLGYAEAELPDRFQEWENRLHPDDRERMLRRVAQYRRNPWPNYEEEFRLRHRDGSYRWILTTAELIRDAAGTPVRMLGCHIDVTERKRAEEERLLMLEKLRRSEVMSAMGALVGGVAHEVRNPLFGISATLDAFEARFGDRAEFRGYLAALRREAERLGLLMEDLLDYGRPQSLDLTRTGVGALLDEAAADTASAAEEAGVTVERRLSEDLPAILADRTRIHLVLRNLIENAIQHSPRGGVVTVSVRRAPDAGGEGLECVVRDRGSGFPEEDLPRIFEPFFSRRKGGTGLGLAIVRRIVEDHRGTVTASNHEAGGALVRLRLPLALGPRPGMEGPA